MSYCRWSDSYWYIYHSVYSIPFSKKEQFLVIAEVGILSWQDIVNDLSGCIKKIKDACTVIYNEHNQPTKEDLKELEHYLCEFVADVIIDFIHLECFILDLYNKIIKLKKQHNNKHGILSIVNDSLLNKSLKLNISYTNLVALQLILENVCRTIGGNRVSLELL